MSHWVTVLPQSLRVEAADGQTLLSVLQAAGIPVDAPCGGDGRCGKCRVDVNGTMVPACRTAVDRDMTVTVPQQTGQQILSMGNAALQTADHEEHSLVFDVGTTTVVGYLLRGGRELSCVSASNPQAAFGADVMTRIRLAVQGQQSLLTDRIRTCLESLTEELCRQAEISPADIRHVCAVGNPAMQQLLLGISVENLAKVPFAPVLTQGKAVPAKQILPLWEGAECFIVPNIAGFVGSDTVACVLATAMDSRETMTLLVDIGTNAEMVLGNGHTMVACSAAAGPALEGAGIRFGMRGQAGAIDHVWLQDGQLKCSVIGGGRAEGICGSGLIDAVAVALEQGMLNARGKILTGDGLLRLTETVFLDQEDIRQVQLAKGAIAAGITLMAQRMGVSLADIERVYLAGAFGTYMDPKSACRIGLLPEELAQKITAVGNAAGSGAKLLAADPAALSHAQRIVERTQALELSALPEFPRTFAKNMRF